MIGLRP